MQAKCDNWSVTPCFSIESVHNLGGSYLGLNNQNQECSQVRMGWNRAVGLLLKWKQSHHQLWSSQMLPMKLQGILAKKKHLRLT